MISSFNVRCCIIQGLLYLARPLALWPLSSIIHQPQYPLIPPKPAASATSSAFTNPTPSWIRVAQIAFLVAIGHAG